MLYLGLQPITSKKEVMLKEKLVPEKKDNLSISQDPQ